MSETLSVFPNKLPDVLRRQLFWIVKRHSSYTAWARAFAAFDAVIRKMDSLRPELAAKPLGTYGIGLPPDTKPISRWPDWWFTLLRRRNYRAALARLRKGDKRALGTTPPGPLLGLQAENCKYDLVDFFRGKHPDPREGYYSELDPIIPEKSELTRLAELAYCLAAENIELARMASARAFNSVYCKVPYCPEAHCLKIHLPFHPDKKSRDLGRYPIPAELPPVPGPVILPTLKKHWWTPAFRHDGPLVMQSNQRVFLPGIYLSAPCGDIRYLPPNAAAPFLDLGYMKERYLPCTWTLIWRDDRYENGADIPEEEALYFPEG